MTKQENRKKKFLNHFKNLDHLLYQGEVFFRKHKKNLIIGFVFLLFIFVGYFSYQKGYLSPREEKALNLFSDTRERFLKNYEEGPENLEKILGGNPKEGHVGFLDIIKKYPSTKAANFSNFYAGLAFYKLKKYEKAIEHLKAFHSKDDVLPEMKIGMIGDSLVELNKKEEALDHYLRAARNKKNKFTELFFYQKAALLAFSMGKYLEAEKYFELIKKEDSAFKPSMNIDKYLTMTKYKLSK